MPNRILSSFSLGDMKLIYIEDDAGHVGMSLVPGSLSDKAGPEKQNADSLVQLYIRGDGLPGAFAAGVTMSQSESSSRMVYESQSTDTAGGETRITTVLSDGRGYKAKHVVIHKNGSRAVKTKTIFENKSDEPVVLEYISSFSLGMLTPFGGIDETNSLILHRARSWWSAEGKAESGSVLDYHLEQSWSHFGVRAEKFGQVGSMPVRHYFPFAAVEDKKAGVVWAAQLAIPSSWQIEFRRPGDPLCLTGGLADHDFGHWMKTVESGGSFETPEAYLTAGVGSADAVSQRLLDLHSHSQNVKAKAGKGLPVV
ncbi:MAG: alpha-galactosidase, partial [Clostridiales bacterium]|nr:alpha-galactosidase [Clostridiales bacterium]